MSEAAGANTWADLMAEGRLPRFALICLGVWLNAADSLVTATILPSVGADLGGYAYFSWATAGFFVGAIMAGASSGRLSEIFGLRSATALAGVVMVLGCLMSAAAPDVGTFLAGRLVQGLGSGWISGFAMVAIAMLFPERHLARVFAAVTFIWGIATVLGPLFGGIVVEAGHWRDVFWLFAAQAAIFSVASLWLLGGSSKAPGGPGIPWTQLGVLGVAVAAIALADLMKTAVGSIGLVVLGLAILALVVRIDGRARIRLLPHRAGDLSTICGSGYLAMFALTAASMGFAIYGPPILQHLRGFSPLVAGYAIGAESLAWTVAAMAVASVTGIWDARWTRFGVLLLALSLVVLALSLADGHMAWVLLGGSMLGAAFGFSWSFMSKRLLGALSDEDRAIGSSAIMAVRQTGGAVGAAISGVAANLVGFSDGLSDASARGAAFWVFAAVIPLALIGTWATFRMTGSARAATT
ncbi:MAG: MFS transporter [Alphaproteobacteria bacterium]|nr:MFS transporter [Alphaproteobacteria bacterium]MBU1515456.1 MFS transporter [Alphaproteobacteria bacterium]MBU2095454.1 MFS transporter [Alphaproteobacteria bacterium]MBU2150696.1 MFS transporter [Alphaproteobacteria bacterium]MBU2306960.1 MFS transporter [Alphaproteobacteria bacterium]